MDLFHNLMEFVPSVLAQEIEPYLSIEERAWLFIESGATQLSPSQRREWERLYQDEFPNVYAMIGLDGSQVDAYIKLVTEIDPDLLTIFIILQLASLPPAEILININGSTDFTFRLFVQMTPEIRLDQYLLTNLSELLQWGFYSGILYILTLYPHILPTDSITISSLIDGIRSSGEYTVLQYASLESVIKRAVDIYADKNIRLLDVPVSRRYNDVYTMFGMLIVYMTPLALLYTSKANLLYLDLDGDTYLHIAANAGNSSVYKALIKQEPSLLHTANLKGKLAADIMADIRERYGMEDTSNSRESDYENESESDNSVESD